MRTAKLFLITLIIIALFPYGVFSQGTSIPDDPGNMVNYRATVGTTYSIKITGTDQGSVWGGYNGIYTDDSRLGKAAVHAGLLKVGQEGVVKVTILAGQPAYTGSTRNGVTTTSFGAWQGSYKFEAVSSVKPGTVYTSGIITDPGNMTKYRNNNGLTYSINVTGTDQGSVWGGSDGIYTDDSRIGKAAVHAGLLRVGEEGVVQVTVLQGMQKYTGSTKNGISTTNYGAYSGSYRFGGASKNTITAGINITSVPIPGGTFTMGSPLSETTRATDEVQHQVTVSAFRMSKYEITNSQFATFLNAKGIKGDGVYTEGAYPGSVLILASGGSSDFGLHYTGNQWVPVAGYENHPVLLVTWFGADAFATYAGGRLPTEAEWEYACRGNTTSNFNTGDCLSNSEANYDWFYPINPCKNSNTTAPGTTKAVGSYPANAYGLHDMHGNVMEWCSDWYAAYPAAAQTNPAGPKAGVTHVIRGGSWGYMALYARSARRSETASGSIYVGIRVVFAS